MSQTESGTKYAPNLATPLSPSDKKEAIATIPAGAMAPAKIIEREDPKSWRALHALAKELSNSSLVPSTLRGRAADILHIFLTSAELDIPPMLGLRSIFIVDGKPSLAASLCSALVKRSALCEEFSILESTVTIARVRVKRKGSQAEEISWTIDEAKIAGLLTKDNWKKYPKDMLYARAVDRACNAIFPDVTMGLHTTEVLRDSDAFDTMLSDAAAEIPKNEAGIEARITEVLERLNACGTTHEVEALAAWAAGLPEADAIRADAGVKSSWKRRLIEIKDAEERAAAIAAQKAHEEESQDATATPLDGVPTPGVPTPGLAGPGMTPETAEKIREMAAFRDRIVPGAVLPLPSLFDQRMPPPSAPGPTPDNLRVDPERAEPDVSTICPACDANLSKQKHGEGCPEAAGS